jgi:hypothetical protein
MRPLQKLGIVLVLGLVFALPGHAAVLVVNCSSGPYFDIDAAVAASNPGDTIAVQYCGSPYPGTTIAGVKDLHVVAVEPSGAAAEGVGVNMLPPVTIEEPSAPCVVIDSSIDVSFLGFSLEKCDGEGFYVESSEHVVIEGNRIKKSLYAGVRGAGSYNLQVTGNHVIATGEMGIDFIDVKGSLVADNLVDSVATDGIHLDGGGWVKVFNNQVYGSGDRGIAIVSGDAHRTERNSVTGSGADDIECSGGADVDLIADIYGSLVNGCGADVY